MLKYLIDTDILILVRKGKNAKLQARFERMEPGVAAISIITYGELLYGAAKSSNREGAKKRVDQIIEHLPVLEMSVDAGKRYGEIRAHLESEGLIIGNNDLWIAAHALDEDLVLVSNNVREFSRVPSLRLQNWAAD